MVGQESNTFKPNCSLNFVVKISKGTQVFNIGGQHQTLFQSENTLGWTKSGSSKSI
jgi:hypothetical protein